MRRLTFRNQTPRWAPALLLLMGSLSAACGDDDSANPPPGGPNGPTSAEPGVCFGAGTRCDPPEFKRTTPEEEFSVACTEAADLEFLWSATLAGFECRVSDCPASNPMVAAGAGRYWAVAELREPSLDSPFGSGAVVGFGVLSFDESGQLLHSAPANVSSTLQAPIPTAYTRSVQVDANGALLWATVSSDRKGIELRRFRADGEPSSVQLAVVEGESGHAMWTADGSVVLGYRYQTELLTSDPALPKLLPGVARFDASGHLLYNQTLLSASVEMAPSVRTAQVKVGGFGTNGEATFRVPEVVHPGVFAETRLLKLDGNGNVVWASELPNAYASYFSSDADMQVHSDGTSLIVHRSAPSPLEPAPFLVEKLTAEGNSSWRARLEATLLDSAEFTGSVTLDADQRVLIASPSGGTPVVVLFDSNRRACTQHVVRTPSCPGCDKISIAAVTQGRLYFGIGNLIGVAQLP